jgi:hypothetical protein
MKNIIILLLYFTQISATTAQVFGDKIESNILPTGQILLGAASGSGILVASDKGIYFVTAKHNLFNDEILIDSISTIKFHSTDFENEEPKIISVNNLELITTKNLRVSSKQDICVIKLATSEIQDTASGKSIIKYLNGVKRIGKSLSYSPFPLYIKKYLLRKELYLGDEVLTAGFPSSLGLTRHPQFDYDKPLIKRGSVAGLSSKYETFIIDSHVYGGNSGGPVFIERVDFKSYTIYLAGIAVEYIPFVSKSVKSKDIFLQTSSYAVIVPIDYALELIKMMD